MSKEMSTKEAIKILEGFSEKNIIDYRNVGGKLEVVKPSYVRAIETVLAELQELGEINFRLLNNGVPKEVFDELRLKLKKEKNENEANKTANTYNEYILKNSFVWQNNVPDDIYQKLEIIK